MFVLILSVKRMGPKRKLSPKTEACHVLAKKPRPVKTTTEEEFYTAAQRAADRPPTRAEKERIERIRQESLQRKRGEGEEIAAADTQSSNLSCSSEDFYADAMTGTSPSEDSAVEIPPNQQMAAQEEEPDQDDTVVEVSPTRSRSETDGNKINNNTDLKSFLSSRFDALASKQDIQIVIIVFEGVHHNLSEI